MTLLQFSTKPYGNITINGKDNFKNIERTIIYYFNFKIIFYHTCT